MLLSDGGWARGPVPALLLLGVFCMGLLSEAPPRSWGQAN